MGAAAESCGLIESVSVERLVAARDAAVRVYSDLADRIDEARALLSPFGIDMPRIDLHFADGTTLDVSDRERHPAFEREVDRLAWLRLYRLSNVDALMDGTTRRRLWERLQRCDPFMRARDEDESVPPLTPENVVATFGNLADRAAEFHANAVESVFRSVSWDHKTNRPNAIGKRLIVQYGFRVWNRSLQGNGARLDFDGSVADLERVLMVAAGRVSSTNATGVGSMGELPWGQWMEVPAPDGGPSILRVKVFRVGTTHVQILDEALVDDLNRTMHGRYPDAISESECSKAARPRGGRPGDARPRARADRESAGLAVRDKQEAQAFYTPDALAASVAEAAGDLEGLRVLDPSAGHGALLHAASSAGASELVAIENESRACAVLDGAVDRVIPGDFLTMTPDDVGGPFPVVLMNPPFSNGLDAEHVRHALSFVAPGGRLVAIMSTRVLWSNRAEVENLRGQLELAGTWTCEGNPPGSFRESGTMVDTVMLVLDRFQ